MKLQGSSSPHPKAIEKMPHWPSILAGAGASAENNWGRDAEVLRAKELSLLLHMLVAVLLLFPIFHGMAKRQAVGMAGLRTEKIFFPRGGGGGGGDHNPIEARRGNLAPFERIRFSQPGIARNPHAKLIVNDTLLGPPEIPTPPANLIGDPLSSWATDSQGPGSDGGFGKGKRGGIGNGDGGGAFDGKKWGMGGGEPNVPGRNGVGYPECVYCPTPSFSEEARKSKLQGAVTLNIVVGVDGRVTYIHLSRGLGMGLDERAMEAVRGWRFKPALGPDRKPVPTEVQIEVTFRLL